MRSLAIVLFVSSFVAACGGKVAVDVGGANGGSPPGAVPDLACDITSGGLHVCVEYNDLAPDLKAAAASACTGGGAQIVDVCSTADVVGRCSLGMQGVDVVEVFYAGAGTADELATACTGGGGTWTPG